MDFSYSCLLLLSVRVPVRLRPRCSPSRDVSEEIYHEGEPWSETPFVPMHAVSTPLNFELEPLDDEVYTIIPTTFEPGNTGPFILSVVADSDFTLQRDNSKSSSS